MLFYSIISFFSVINAAISQDTVKITVKEARQLLSPVRTNDEIYTFTKCFNKEVPTSDCRGWLKFPEENTTDVVYADRGAQNEGSMQEPAYLLSIENKKLTLVGEWKAKWYKNTQKTLIILEYQLNDNLDPVSLNISLTTGKRKVTTSLNIASKESQRSIKDFIKTTSVYQSSGFVFVETKQIDSTEIIKKQELEKQKLRIDSIERERKNTEEARRVLQKRKEDSIRTEDQKKTEAARIIKQRYTDSLNLLKQKQADSVKLAKQKNDEEIKLNNQRTTDSLRVVNEKKLRIADSLNAIKKQQTDSLKLVNQKTAEELRLKNERIADSIKTAKQKTTDSLRIVNERNLRTTDSLNALKKRQADSIKLASQKTAEELRLKNERIADSIKTAKQKTADSLRIVNERNLRTTDSLNALKKRQADSIKLASQKAAEELKLKNERIADSIKLSKQRIADSLKLSKLTADSIANAKKSKKPTLQIIRSDNITDIDGFQYKTVRMGNQTWMAENLNVTRFRNGDPIMEAQTMDEWREADLAGIPAWCYYNEDAENAPQLGKLYNWHAVRDARGLAPTKWHIPNMEEWTRMFNFIGGNQKAGAILKDTTGWHENGNGSSMTGFAAKPSGSRDFSSNFKGVKRFGYWWVNEEHGAETAWGIDMGFSYGNINLFAFRKGNGFAVRCVRD